MEWTFFMNLSHARDKISPDWTPLAVHRFEEVVGAVPDCINTTNLIFEAEVSYTYWTMSAPQLNSHHPIAAGFCFGQVCVCEST